MNKRDPVSPLIATGAVLGFFALIAVILVAGDRAGWTFGDASGGKGNHLVLVALVYIALQKAILLSVLTTIAVHERRSGRPSSALLLPLIAVDAFLEGYLAIEAVAGLDLLAHGFHRRWDVLATPTAHTVLVLFLLALPLADASLLAVIGRGYGVRWRWLIALFLLTALVCAGAVWGAVRWL